MMTTRRRAMRCSTVCVGWVVQNRPASIIRTHHTHTTLIRTYSPTPPQNKPTKPPPTTAIAANADGAFAPEVQALGHILTWQRAVVGQQAVSSPIV